MVREGVEGVVPYDHLILATGLQFSLPPVSPHSTGETPLIYDANDGLGVLEWARKYLESEGLSILS